MKFHIYSSKELNFVELNITDTNSNFEKCDPGSKFLDSVVFKLFTECFIKANNRYTYYDATKYDSRFIIPLRNQLLTNLTILENIDSLTRFQEYVGSKTSGKEFLLSLVKVDKNWTGRWIVYLEKLRQINSEIMELVDLCIDEDKVLWVIGY